MALRAKSESERQRDEQHAHEVDALAPEGERDETDERTPDEDDDAEPPRQEPRERRDEERDADAQPSVVDSADDPEEVVTDEWNQDEPDGRGHRDAREEEREVERRAGAVQRDQNACVRLAEGDEGVEREDGVLNLAVVTLLTHSHREGGRERTADRNSIPTGVPPDRSAHPPSRPFW